MATTSTTPTFGYLGIGSLLTRHRLAVPVNQREYAWEEEHVLDLLQDFSGAIAEGQDSYFLGTVVLTRGESDAPEVTDGQQRLATISILLAAIRDYFHNQGDRENTQAIQGEFINKFDRDSQSHLPRLTLNVSDNEFFRKRILSLPETPDRNIEPTRESHRKLAKAAELAAEHVQKIIATHKEERRLPVLNTWVSFIERQACVILLAVPDELNAYVMFETLNDRGLKTTQSDLLKNYLFGQAGNRLREAQHKWAAMTGILESLGIDDIALTYLRHVWISLQGPVREKDLYDRMKKTIAGPQKSIEFLDALADDANYYVALFNSNHPHWNEYGRETRKHLDTIIELRVAQIRPLMLSVVRRFSVREVQRAFRMFVCWSVRFLVAGGTPSSFERHYAVAAQSVNNGELTNAIELARFMAKVVPDDSSFKSAFAVGKVSKAYLARYYLRSLEQCAKDDPYPELIINDDESVLNLEHVVPQAPSESWGIDPDTAAGVYRRLGNMALLQAKLNSEIGNDSFGEKKGAYAKSSMILTKQIAEAQQWGIHEINARQSQLADYAVKTWPLIPDR